MDWEVGEGGGEYCRIYDFMDCMLSAVLVFGVSLSGLKIRCVNVLKPGSQSFEYFEKVKIKED